jgi:O-antigen/teichoic acid export membrane protein
VSTARKVLSNTAYQLLGRVIMAGMAVIILKMITQYLGVSGYGDYVTIYEYLGFFAIFADLGIYTIAVKEMSKNEQQRATIIGNIMALRSTLAIILMGLAVVIGFILPQYQGTLIPVGIFIAAFTTFFTMLQGTICSVLQVHYKMQYSTLSMVLGKLASLVYVIIVIYYLYPQTGVMAVTSIIDNLSLGGSGHELAAQPLENGFWHLLLGGIIGGVVMYYIASFYARKLIKFRFRFDYNYWIEVLKTAVPYGLALILNNIYFKIDILLLSLLIPPESAGIQTGIYGVAMRILEMLVIIPVYFMNSVLPLLMKYIREDSAKLTKLIQYSFDFLIAASLPILVGIGLLALPIVRLISTNEFVTNLNRGFYGSDIALQILMFALVFSFINSLFGFILVAVEKQIKLLWINSACVLFNLIANIIFIPSYGFIGAALTSVLSELFILFLVWIVARKYIGVTISLIPTLKYSFSALIMGGAIFFLIPFLPGNFWLLLIPGGGIVYAISIIATGAVNKEMRGMIRK